MNIDLRPLGLQRSPVTSEPKPGFEGGVGMAQPRRLILWDVHLSRWCSPPWGGCNPTFYWGSETLWQTGANWTLNLSFLPWKMGMIIPGLLRQWTGVGVNQVTCPAQRRGPNHA